MSTPRISVVIPAYKRPELLRRALKSVEAQTLTDFECIVVDDCSPEPLGPVVDEFDDRFRCIRRETNGGVTSCRVTGFFAATAPYAVPLDSDNEYFPWTLERVVARLDAHPEASIVCGLYLFESIHARVAGGTRLVTPEDFRRDRLAIVDSVAGVRREVIEFWRGQQIDYFNLDSGFWILAALEFAQLFVDEPWGRFYEDGAPTERVSTTIDQRSFDDVVRFIGRMRPQFGAQPCPALDDTLYKNFRMTRRHGRKAEEAVIVDWMKERGLNTRGMAIARAEAKVKNRAAGGAFQVRI